MSVSDENLTGAPAKAAWFTTTHWSVVLAAGQCASPQATDALEKLCRTYWYPLYAYVRRQGYDATDAQDLTQGFFARLLEKDYLSQVDRRKGKFRSFLLASLNHFLADEGKRARAEKRGGQHVIISLEDETAQHRYRQEPASDLSPEQSFDLHWALAVLDQALARLRAESAAAGKARQIDRLNVFLSSATSDGAYAAAATELEMSTGAVAAMVHRLRRRYRDLAREEIAHTVARPADIEEEMHYLFALLSG